MLWNPVDRRENIAGLAGKTMDLDFTQWPMWLKLLAGWGPLGVWAGTAQYSKGKTEQAYHKTRDGHENALKSIAERHAEALQEQANQFTQKIEGIQVQHQKDISVMADRFIQLTTTYAERSHQLIDKVAALTDAIRRGGSNHGGS